MSDMEDLMDMIASDEAPSKVTDAIKDILFQKSAEKVDDFKASVSTNMFNGITQTSEEEEEV